MLPLLRDLIAHKAHANRLMLDAVRQNDAAAADAEILALLHHVLVANRFWHLMLVGEAFVAERELTPPRNLAHLIEMYDALHAREAVWISTVSESDLGRVIETPHIPGGRCSMAEGLTQVALHSHGHRAQIAKMLRAKGSTPPMTDFILWVAQRATVG